MKLWTAVPAAAMLAMATVALSERTETAGLAPPISPAGPAAVKHPDVRSIVRHGSMRGTPETTGAAVVLQMTGLLLLGPAAA